VKSAPTVFQASGQYQLAFSQRTGPTSDPTEVIRFASLTGTPGGSFGLNGASYLNSATVDASGYFGQNCTTVLGTEQCAWMMPGWSTGQYPNVGIGSVWAMASYQGSRPVFSSTHMYAALGNRLVCYDFNGNLAWEYNHAPGTAWRLLNPPSLAGDKLVLTDWEGAVMMFDASTGALQYQWNTGYHITQQAALVDGNIYVGTSNGHVLVINSGDTNLTGWTQWGGSATRNK
jgi:outer membrane protein assembly factor BamB